MKNVYFVELSGIDGQAACLDSLFAALSDALGKDKLEELKEAVYMREDTASTFVGDAMAAPHGRVANLGDPLLVFGISKNGIDWPTDEEKAKLVALIAVDKTQVAAYLSIFQKIAKWHKKNSALLGDVDFSAIKNSIERDMR